MAFRANLRPPYTKKQPEDSIMNHVVALFVSGILCVSPFFTPKVSTPNASPIGSPPIIDCGGCAASVTTWTCGYECGIKWTIEFELPSLTSGSCIWQHIQGCAPDTIVTLTVEK